MKYRPETKLLCGIILAFAILNIIATFFFSPMNSGEQSPELSACWNTQDMKPAQGMAQTEAETIYRIERVFESEDEFPKGLRIESAEIQDDRVLVVFERYRNLKRSLDRDHLAVYDTSGQWLYGFEGVVPYESIGIALRPDREGILFRKWKLNQTDNDLFLLVGPDGSKQAFAAEKLGSDIPAYWHSEYSIVDTKESRLVISHDATGEQTTVFDYSAEYPQMYLGSSKIDEDDEKLFGMLFPFIMLLVMIIVLPKMLDHPDVPKRGIKESYGDLRDRWR